ncbi:hypothetical protein [Vibrio nigripulchritudo]|uniref:hypothetical protein n=1 Tax=Vibrio nigripulchritudo TaxID=28173 RepID=UPI0003B18151|nr:hypothetical protein [Vibrio nigripulchritudo]CCN69787.1 conserved hypothetical protein [Vibrio nigripulchritudo SFn118]
MARKERKKILAFALESGYGVDAISGSTPKYLLGREFSITPMAGESTSLDYDNGVLGNSAEIMTELYVTIEFTVDLAASGQAKLAAPFGDLMKGCLRKVDAFDVVAGAQATEVMYSIDENAAGSLTFYFYQSGALHKITGARGSFSMSVKAKEFGGIKFSFSGLYSPVVNAAIPTPDFSAWQTPLKVGVQNSSFTIDGAPFKMISLEYDQANAVIHQEYVGHEEVLITDYKPTGTLVIEAPEQSAWDAFAIAQAGAEHALVFSNGPVGNQFEWKSPKVQLGRPTYGEQDGTQTLSIPLIPIGNVDTFATR